VSSPRAKKYLAIDIDSCALTFATTSPGITTGPDLLSPELVAHAKAGSYDGFYVCTHRCFRMALEASLLESRVLLQKHGFTKPIDTNNLLTYRIANHFSKATGLVLLGVSTPDDSSPTANNQCGYGFENFLKPIELKMHAANRNNKGLSLDIFTRLENEVLSRIDHSKDKTTDFLNSKSKNIQLLQISQHIANNNPNTPFTMHYVDDQNYLCSNTFLDAATRFVYNTRKIAELKKSCLGPKYSSLPPPEELYQALGAMQLNIQTMPFNLVLLEVLHHAPHMGINCRKIGIVDRKGLVDASGYSQATSSSYVGNSQPQHQTLSGHTPGLWQQAQVQAQKTQILHVDAPPVKSCCSIM
jgi:hypothetical protein